VILLKMSETKQFLAISVTSNVNTFHTERRFPSDINIGNLKVLLKDIAL
jgi:hypothetical protein